MGDPPRRPAGDIGSDATLDGSVLATASPIGSTAGGRSAAISRGGAMVLQRELPPELDRSGLSERERDLVISRYRLLSQLGAGGMGLVYLAYDPSLDRKVAIKLLRPGGDGVEPAAEAHARLHREAQALAKLSHPNVVAVHDVGTYDASALYGAADDSDSGQGVFIVMEYIEGVTLARWLEDRPRGWQEILAVFIAAGRGLVAAHAVGVIHRDFKPSNVLVRRDDSVHVFDFGLARSAGKIEAPRADTGAEATSHEPWSSTLSSPLTQFGAFVGTPAYMAPEQRGGEQVDERSDQFSFCVALHEGLYGNRPFSGDTLYLLEMAKASGRMDPPKHPRRLPKGLHRAIVRGLAEDPRLRWPTMPALLAELERTLRRRRGRIVAAVLTVGLLGAGAGAYAVQRGSVCTDAPAAFADAWSETSRAAISQAFTATGLPYAEDTLARVTDRLGDYRLRWLAVHTDACEAANVRRSQSYGVMDRRMVCLQQRRDELAALLDVLARADADVVEHAVAAVASLPAVEQCADLVALEGAGPLSSDPTLTLAAASVRRGLAAVLAEHAAGRYAAARELAREALAAADRLDDRRLRADAERLLGLTQLALADLVDSERSLSAAFFDGLASGQDTTAMLAAGTAATLVGNQLARPAEGLVWTRHLDALLDRHGRPPALAAHYHVARASIATRTGDYAQAAASSRAAIAALELAEPRDELAIADALKSLASALASVGKLAESLELLQRSLDIHTDALGPAHPLVAAVLQTMGGSYALLGDNTAAEQVHHRALQIWRASLPPGHERLGYPLSALGDIAGGRAHYEEARAYYEEANTIWRNYYGPEHPRVLGMQERLAGMLCLQGALAPAHETAEAALRVWNTLPQPDPAGLTLILVTRAQIAIAEKDYVVAHASLMRAHNIAAAAFGADHLYTLITRMLLLGLRVEQEAHAEALPGLLALLQELEAQLGKDGRWLVEPLIYLGRAHHGVGDQAAARAVLERARKLATDHDLPGLLGEIDLDLARVLWTTPADRSAALARAQAAVQAHQRSGAARLRAEAEAWLREHSP